MDSSEVKDGMPVFTADGHRLGKVVSRDAGGFVVEKGILFRRRYFCAYEDLSGQQEGALVLARDLDYMQLLGRRPRPPAQPEIRVPVVEEELDAQKTVHETGRVRIHKEVVTETRHIAVPVMKEEVVIERVPGTGAAPAPGTSVFEQEDVSVPVYEEEIEIRKRPVVREVVKVSKSSHEERREASADTRREEVTVQEEGTVNEPQPHGNDPDRRT